MLYKLALGFALCSTSAGVFCQTITDIQISSGNSAYALDARGTILRSQYGLCWRTGTWTSADATTGCDGQLAPPIAKTTAPAVPAYPAPVMTASASPANTAATSTRCDFAVTLANDQTFKVNSAVLSNTAKKRIDDAVINKLADCSKIDIVLVTGHTDRLGSHQYNQKLSAKRANIVAGYLKDKGVRALIETRAAGESQPVKSCNAEHRRNNLVECLAPNRRVVIETSGLAK
jgi:OOP family OmpA-OmpF porin